MNLTTIYRATTKTSRTGSIYESLNQELIETLKLMNENNETQMKEYMKYYKQSQMLKLTNVDGITNN